MERIEREKHDIEREKIEAAEKQRKKKWEAEELQRKEEREASEIMTNYFAKWRRQNWH